MMTGRKIDGLGGSNPVRSAGQSGFARSSIGPSGIPAFMRFLRKRSSRRPIGALIFELPIGMKVALLQTVVGSHAHINWYGVDLHVCVADPNIATTSGGS